MNSEENCSRNRLMSGSNVSLATTSSSTPKLPISENCSNAEPSPSFSCSQLDAVAFRSSSTSVSGMEHPHQTMLTSGGGPPPPTGSTRRFSRVWCYFTMMDNYHYTCKLCNFVGTYTNTTNMRKHIQHHHPERYQDILDHTRPTTRPNIQYYSLEQQQQNLQQLNDHHVEYRDRTVATAAHSYNNNYAPVPQLAFNSFDNSLKNLEDSKGSLSGLHHSSFRGRAALGSQGPSSTISGYSSLFPSSSKLVDDQHNKTVTLDKAPSKEVFDFSLVNSSSKKASPRIEERPTTHGCDGSAVPLSGIEAVVAAAAAAAIGGPETSEGASMTPQRNDRPPLPQLCSPSPANSNNKPESYQLRHNNHLSLVLNQLAEDEAFMDVTLTAGGRNVKAHKSVLSAVSPYFSEVLRANPCQHPIIIMPRDIRFTDLSSMIMYIYRGEVTVSAEDLSSFLKTAEILKVNGLSPEQNNSQQQSTVNPVSASTVFSQANLVTRTSNPKPNSNSSSSSKPNSIHFTQNSSDKNLPEDSNVQTMLNPTDFMDLDMTCVKEELQSDEEEDVLSEAVTPKEVTTPPPIGYHPPSNHTDPPTSPKAEECPDKPGSSQETSLDSDSELRQNSLKTLANLASLNTPTDLSPADSSSPPENSPEPSPNVCPHCSLYVPASELTTHLDSKHSFKPSFVCKSCHRVYTKKLTYETHLKSCSEK